MKQQGLIELDVKECPTCGSPHRFDRGLRSDWDADGVFKNRPVSVQLPDWSNFDTKSGKWYSGYCPDAWHDVERRSGKDRRRRSAE